MLNYQRVARFFVLKKNQGAQKEDCYVLRGLYDV